MGNEKSRIGFNATDLCVVVYVCVYVIFVLFSYFWILQQPSQCSSAEKIDTNRRSRWWRIRSILALVFRRRRRNN